LPIAYGHKQQSNKIGSGRNDDRGGGGGGGGSYSSGDRNEDGDSIENGDGNGYGNSEINKLLNKLSQILLCTIWTDKGLFDCRV